AVGAVWVSSFTAKRAAGVSFVRYADAAKAVVQLNNQSDSATFYFVPGGVRLLEARVPDGVNTSSIPETSCFIVVLSARNACQIEVLAGESASNLVVRWGGGRSRARRRIEDLLSNAGIDITHTGFVVSVDLPPRPATPFLGPTNQNTP
ncbi:MAG TPA: hypothetical protein VNH84_00710, partial [Candidatus Saccharimonadales bacterium]|nr:hypothetical protein [Candidatus Saccharimonadales bacterium]